MRSIVNIILTLLLLVLVQYKVTLSLEDEYISKTGQTRQELLRSGEYISNSIFKTIQINSKVSRSIEYYLPLDARMEDEGSTNDGYIKWPKTFLQNLNKIPKSILRVTYTLHTLHSPTSGEIITHENLTTIQISKWNITAGIKILIHGYKQRGSNLKMPQAQKDAYLLMENLDNIVIVDWEHLANHPHYFESAIYTQKVGEKLGQFIVTLKNFGYISSYRNVHIIGHCLGAHVGGVAGKYVRDHSGGRSLVWRITGLDPAGPGFQHARNEIRLDITDAQFVDVIHTNIGENFLNGELGMINPCGHVDFYPNGGVLQPVCGDIITVGNLISKCSHKKAADYYTRSIKGEKFRSCKCTSWGTYTNGVCDCTMGPFMGEYTSPDITGKHYLRVFEYSLFEIFEQLGVIGSD